MYFCIHVYMYLYILGMYFCFCICIISVMGDLRELSIVYFADVFLYLCTYVFVHFAGVFLFLHLYNFYDGRLERAVYCVARNPSATSCYEINLLFMAFLASDPIKAAM